MLLMSRVNIMVKRPNADSCSGMINEEIMVTHRSVSQQSAPPELPLVGASELLHEVDSFPGGSYQEAGTLLAVSN